MKKEKLAFDGKEIFTYENYENGPMIYLIEGHTSEEELGRIISRVKKLTGKAPWKVAIFSADSWNDDLSPWQGNDAKGEKAFGGKGEETLKKLPQIFHLVEGENTPRERCIAGYSLAGLFSLWAALQTEYFSGAATMSGSLWFDGWDEYIEKISVKRQMKVFISLGMKEEKTKDPLMSTVGDRTRRTHEVLESHANIRTVLKMNPGGHFTEVDLRIADGIAWLIKE